jgi:hypothetical protein
MDISIMVPLLLDRGGNYVVNKNGVILDGEILFIHPDPRKNWRGGDPLRIRCAEILPGMVEVVFDANLTQSGCGGPLSTDMNNNRRYFATRTDAFIGIIPEVFQWFDKSIAYRSSQDDVKTTNAIKKSLGKILQDYHAGTFSVPDNLQREVLHTYLCV